MAQKNEEVTGWVGWIAFASLLLYISGFFSIFTGFIALFKHTVFYHAASDTFYVLNYSQWGWVHIGVGLLALIAAASLAKGNYFGRTVAVVLAVISLLANMAFVPIYPLWSIIIMIVDVLVIYAVTVHGKEVKKLQ